MAEQVRIDVVAGGDTRAITDTERKIRDLHKAADEYDKKGMTSAAKSARSEAVGMQKDLIGKRLVDAGALRSAGNNAAADAVTAEVEEMQRALALQTRFNLGRQEAINLARAQLTHERELAALKKAGLLGGNSRVIGDVLDSATGSQGWVNKMMAVNRLPHIIEALSKLGPGALLGGAAVAVGAAGLAYVNSYIEAREKEEEISDKRGEEWAKDRRKGKILQSFRGSASEATQGAFENEQDLADRREHEKELERQTKLKWYNPLRWSDAAFGTDFRHKNVFGEKNDGQRAIDENKAQEDRDEREAARKKAIAMQQFNEGEGGLELNIARDTAQHNVGGFKKRIVDQASLDWLKEYKRVLHEVGDSEKGEAIAAESANLKVQESLRDRQIHSASGLINARSGSGDIAQAASLASGLIPGWKDVSTQISALHKTVKAHGEAVTRRDFSGS